MTFIWSCHNICLVPNIFKDGKMALLGDPDPNSSADSYWLENLRTYKYELLCKSWIRMHKPQQQDQSTLGSTRIMTKLQADQETNEKGLLSLNHRSSHHLTEWWTGQVCYGEQECPEWAWFGFVGPAGKIENDWEHLWQDWNGTVWSAGIEWVFSLLCNMFL